MRKIVLLSLFLIILLSPLINSGDIPILNKDKWDKDYSVPTETDDYIIEKKIKKDKEGNDKEYPIIKNKDKEWFQLIVDPPIATGITHGEHIIDITPSNKQSNKNKESNFIFYWTDNTDLKNIQLFELVKEDYIHKEPVYVCDDKGECEIDHYYNIPLTRTIEI